VKPLPDKIDNELWQYENIDGPRSKSPNQHKKVKELKIRCYGMIPKYLVPFKDCPKPINHNPYPTLGGDNFEPKPVSDAEFGESIPEKIFF
jgi:hypothetical protein